MPNTFSIAQYVGQPKAVPNLLVRAFVSELAQRVYDALQRKKMSARQASLLAGLSKNYVQSILDGESENPTTAKLEALAGVLGVTVDHLVNGTPMPSMFPDGLERILEERWWEPLDRPEPRIAAQVVNEARAEKNLGATGLSGAYWRDFLHSRLKQVKRPDKVIEGTTVVDAGTDNPRDDVSGGKSGPKGRHQP